MLTGAAALVSMLRAAGIDNIFAYPGTSELALCDAATSAMLSVVNSRGDKEAVFMAAGGNVAQPSRHAAILHGARGLTNALGAVADIRRGEISVLCIVGLPSRESAQYLPPHAEANLITSAGAFARSAHDCSLVKGFEASAFCTIVANALSDLRKRPGGPIILGVPQDLLLASFVPAELAGVPLVEAVVSTQDIDAICETLITARRPLFLVDDFLFRSGDSAEAALGRIAEKLSAPVFQIAYRRGPMLFQRMRQESVPNYMGQYDPVNTDHRYIFAATDLLITVEDRNMYPRMIGSLPSCRKIAITSEARATRKNRYLGRCDLLIEGDITELLIRINVLINSKSKGFLSEQLWRHGHPHASDCSHSATALVQGLAKGLAHTNRPVLVDDSQMLGGLIDRNYDALPATIRVVGSHGGFVGSGVAMGVGMAMSAPDLSIVCLVGDQGYTNGIQALAVAGEIDAPLVIIICNNGSSVSLRKQALSEGLSIGTAAASVLMNNERMNYGAIARGYGLESSTFHWPDQDAAEPILSTAADRLAELVAELLVFRRPYVLELVTPGDIAFWKGVWNVAGYETGVPDMVNPVTIREGSR